MYEYKVLVLKVKNMEEAFNKYAKEGWRVVKILPNVAMDYVVYSVICTLEREKDYSE